MEGDGTLFEGKVAFVTGGASGVGRAAALAFARHRASVVVADVSDQGNQETARVIEQEGGRALAVRCDVRRAEKDTVCEQSLSLERVGLRFSPLPTTGCEPLVQARFESLSRRRRSTPPTS